MLVSFAFGDLEAGAWGAGWFPDGERGTAVIAAEAMPATLARERDDWRLGLQAGELVLAPVGEAVSEGEAADQLCRVRGRTGTGAEIDAIGWRHIGPALPAHGWSSLRQAAAWFDPDQGVALTALRPADGGSHGEDELVAAVLGGDPNGPAEDPRLSTTYGPDGQPARVGLELWLAKPESEDLYPVRAAGEGLGPRTVWQQDGTELSAQLFRWHSRSQVGPGVFLLARRA